MQPVEAGGGVGLLPLDAHQQGAFHVAGGQALAQGHAFELPARRQGEGTVRGGQGLGRGEGDPGLLDGVWIAKAQQRRQRLGVRQRRRQHEIFAGLVGMGPGQGQHGPVLQPEAGEAVEQHQGQGGKAGPGVDAAHPLVVMQGKFLGFHTYLAGLRRPVWSGGDQKR
ncbi:hypothetical protein D3C80_1407660 [compost metagenome]